MTVRDIELHIPLCGEVGCIERGEKRLESECFGGSEQRHDTLYS